MSTRGQRGRGVRDRVGDERPRLRDGGAGAGLDIHDCLGHQLPSADLAQLPQEQVRLVYGHNYRRNR